jgi:hypothetical protein
MIFGARTIRLAGIALTTLLIQRRAQPTVLVTAASGCRSTSRRSIACVVRQAGQRPHRNQYRVASAAPIVGANYKGHPPGLPFVPVGD